MSSSASPGTSAGKRKVLSLKLKRAILDEVRRNVKKTDIARKYDIAQSTLSTIIKNAGKIDAVLDDDVGGGDRKRIRGATYPDVEAALYKWFVDARAKNIPLSGPLMLQKARDLGFALHHDDFQPGTGWLQRFKDRHDIKCKNIVGEAASVDDPSLQKWMEKNLDRILETYADKDIYNADETGLFFQLLPAKTLAAKTDKCVGGKNSKNRITVLVCSNMDGSDKRDLLIIGKAKKPRGFAKVLSMPVAYSDNKKAWMTRDIFTKWLTDFDKAMDKKKRKVLLLLDNCSAHHVNAHLSAVEVLFLPPNTTAKLQPMDQGVIANFKVHYRRRVIERLLIDIRTAVDPASLKVPLEKAIFFASGAWRDVKPQTILHCFQKGGFSRSSGAVESPAGNGAAAADGDAAATCLGRLWETASKVDLVPPGLDHMDFAFADDDIVATEDVSTEDLAKSVVDESADDTASDDDCDDGRISQPVTSGAAVAAVDVLRMYFGGSDPSFDLQFDKFEAAIVKRSLANSVQGTLDGFLQKE